MARAIGTLGTIDSITVGGRVFTDLTNIITLIGVCTAGTGNSSLRLLNGTAGYPVTTAKTLKILAIAVQILGTGATDSFGLGYSDNDVGFGTATAPTNPVYVGGAAINQYTPAGSLQSLYEFNYGGGFSIPAAKFVLIQNAGSSQISVTAYGYEV